MKRPLAMTTEEAVMKHVSARRSFRKDRRFTQLIESIYSLGGGDGVIAWAWSRVDKGIGSPAEITQLRSLLRTTHQAEERGHKRLMKAWEKEWQRELIVREYEQVWLRLLREKDLRERAKSWRVDPRKEIHQRLIAMRAK